MSRARVLLGLSSAAIGMSAAMAIAVTLGLLLYPGEGLYRALAGILATLAFSFGMGLVLAIPKGSSFRVVLRRRWRGLLLAFVLAALYSTTWSAPGDTASQSLRLGLGLAVLGVLPLLAGGMVLGTAAQVHEWMAPPASEPFAWAVFGFGAGVIVAGVALGSDRFLPPTLLVLGIVVVSAGSLLQALGIQALEGQWVPEEPPPGGESDGP